MRLIDADGLYEVIKNSWDTSDAEDFEKSVFVALATAPTIEERQTGKWKEHEKYPNLAYLCSECGYFTTLRSHFCPNCGAKMENADAVSRKYKEIMR